MSAPRVPASAEVMLDTLVERMVWCHQHRDGSATIRYFAGNGVIARAEGPNLKAAIEEIRRAIAAQTSEVSS